MNSNTDSELAALFSSLGVRVLKRRRDGAFVMVTEAPPWFRRVFTTGAEALSESVLAALIPFLGAFFVTAKPFWERGETGELRSGPWTETDSTGQDHHLEASAFRSGASQLLVLETWDRERTGMPAVLQKARDTSLTNESLTKQLQACQTSIRSVAFDMSDACRGIEKFLETLNPGHLTPTELQYFEIARRQVQKLKELVRELDETARSAATAASPSAIPGS